MIDKLFDKILEDKKLLPIEQKIVEVLKLKEDHGDYKTNEQGDIVEVHIKGEKFKEIPSCITLLPYLKILKINHFPTVKIPRMKPSRTIKKLTFNTARLAKIENMDLFPNLETLRITNNLPYENQWGKPSPENKVDNIKPLKLEGLDCLEKLKWLYIGTAGIRKIEGLEYLKNLTSLTLNNENIEKIEGLDNLKKLIELELQASKISKIENIQHLKNLIGLVLDDNNISKIEGLGDMGQLENIVLKRNHIRKIEGLEHLTNLKVLDLRNNEISKIEGLQNLTHLKYLGLSSNNIRKIEGLESLTSLTTLDLGGNKISQLEGLDQLQNLERLELFPHNIPNIAIEVKKLRKFKNLKEVFFEDSGGYVTIEMEVYNYIPQVYD